MRATLIPTSSREIGDLQRDAVVYIARRTATTSSSFERQLHVRIEEARLGSLAYLASIGFLFASGVINAPLAPKVLEAVARAEKRPDSTDERTGLVDDVLQAVGLLLLARSLGKESLTQRLEKALDDVNVPSPSLRLVASCGLGRAIGRAHLAPEMDAEFFAAAALLRNSNASIVRDTFPLAPVDSTDMLFSAVLAADFEFNEELGDMVVLAALETKVKMNDLLPPADGSCDVGIVVPLKDEFRVFFERIRGKCTDVTDGGRTYYVFEVPTATADVPYRCVVTVMGDQAPTRAGIVAEKLMGKWSPESVAMIGIAGGIHKDVRLGDVVVATQVNNYVEGAKVADDDKTFRFERTNDSFKADAEIVDRALNLEFTDAERFRGWRSAVAARHQALLAKHSDLSADILEPAAEVREGHIASGPAVNISKNFTTWITDGDRACLAVEMEAAGLMIAAHLDPKRTRTLVVRGVSDLADDRKGLLDAIGKGALRALAMENATSFLWMLFETGALPRRLTPGLPNTRAAQETLEQAVLRVLREHADDDGEVTASWTVIRAWIGPSPEGDVQAAAIHLKDDGFFRSQTFTGGPDGDCNVTLRR